MILENKTRTLLVPNLIIKTVQLHDYFVNILIIVWFKAHIKHIKLSASMN